MAKKLRLNFNERSDFISPLEEEYPFDGTLWQYPERQSLEAQIAEKFQLTNAQVLCTNGGDEAIMILMRIIKESSQMILPLPAFSQYTWGVESWQLECLQIPCHNDLSMNITATIAAISENSVTVITRPNNPSGEMISFESLLKIIEAAAEKNAWVFLDEAYIEFSESQSVAANLLEQFDNVVILRTLSKAYGLAGIRLGYLLGPEKLIAEFKQRCALFNVPQPSLLIAEKALSEDNQADMESFCKQIINNRQKLYQWLKENNLPVLPSEGNFLVLALPGTQSRAVAAFLERNNILVRTFNDDEMANCVRITIPYKLENLQHLLSQALLPELVCLDMDGVLIDTSGSYDATIIATVKQLSGKDLNKSDIDQLKSAGGYNNDWVVAQKLLQDVGVNKTLPAVTEVFQKLYLGDNNDGLVSNESALINKKLINTIKKSAATFAVVTGRPLDEAMAGKKLIGLENLDLVSLDCVKEAKPSPEGINRLQQQYSSKSWMCGDNPDDMQAAIASNSMAIGISAINKESLYHCGADIVLDSINQLDEWLSPQSRDCSNIDNTKRRPLQ